MTDSNIYFMQLQRAQYALMRAYDKAGTEYNKRDIQAALRIVERLKGAGNPAHFTPSESKEARRSRRT